MLHYFGKHSASTVAETCRYFSFPPLLIHGLLQPYNFGRAQLRLNFAEHYEACNLKMYNEIDTATHKCEVKIHT